VEVLVEEGLVKLSNPDLSKSEQLHVGEKGIFIKETNEVKKETDIDVESLYWLNKSLLFKENRDRCRGRSCRPCAPSTLFCPCSDLQEGAGGKN
jgi:hypothetical protein